MRRALLLLNFGTPAAPNYWSVAAYLRQLLTDPKVLDIHPAARHLLGGVLIPLLRARRSARAYRSIWTEQGSPLQAQTQALSVGMQQELADYRVWHAMRLGQPSIAAVMAQVRAWQPQQLTLLPLYPQYAVSTTETALQRVREELASWRSTPALRVIEEYADAPGLAAAFAEPVRRERALATALQAADCVLFSFHSLPVRHIRAACQRGYRSDCPCLQGEAAEVRNLHCYRAACYTTARAIAAEFALPEKRWQVSFQSRLGGRWLQPFSSQVVSDLAHSGARRLFVFCPSFATDCLETLEEIGIGLAAQFCAAGGEKLDLAPCPNAGVKWIKFLSNLVRKAGISGRDRPLDPACPKNLID